MINQMDYLAGTVEAQAAEIARLRSRMTDEETLAEALALLREWGTSYDDPRYKDLAPYGDRIQDFLARVDSGRSTNR